MSEKNQNCVNDDGDGGGGGSMDPSGVCNDILDIKSRNESLRKELCSLASETCEAVAEGDGISKLFAVLNISSGSNHRSHNPSNDRIEFLTPSRQCLQIYSMLCFLMGNDGFRLSEIAHGENGIGNHDEIWPCGFSLDVPMAVRAHLLLRALLQIPSDKYLISWDAATAAIHSLQFSTNRNVHSSSSYNRTTSLSQGEELAMIAEIRSFVNSFQNERTAMHLENSYHRNEDTRRSIGSRSPEFSDTLAFTSTQQLMAARKDMLIQTLSQLHDLGKKIIAPLLRPSYDDPVEHNTAKVRRPRSYLLPLELIPAILSTADWLDGALENFQSELAVEDDDDLKIDNSKCESIDMDEESNSGGISSNQPFLRVSDKLLSTMFSSFSNHDGKFMLDRCIRADSCLPLLALAMDDIGFSRMAARVPGYHGATYWDCVRFALNDVLRANLFCYLFGAREYDPNNSYHTTIYDETSLDEFIHLVPLPDYLALFRCVIRMVSVVPSNEISQSSSLSGFWSWESLLLKLYHAAAIVSTKSPNLSSIIVKKTGNLDQTATLSMAETHVLLPSFTGASVSSIKSILKGCLSECCPSCKESKLHTDLGDSLDLDLVPPWVVTGVALLIMRARAGTLSYSSISHGVGPRTMFRVASEMTRKISIAKGLSSERGDLMFSGDDEVGFALKVLLQIPNSNEGGCLQCSDEYVDNNDAEKSAYDVLRQHHVYYAGNGLFQPRLGCFLKESSFAQQLGLRTLSSYSDLIRSSLNKSSLPKYEIIQDADSCIADTARAWIDAANMMLDEGHQYLNRKKASTHDHASIKAPPGFSLAIVAIVVIFCEVPSSRHEIIRFILDRLNKCQNDVDFERNSNISCFVLISTLSWSLSSSDTFLAEQSQKSSLSVGRDGCMDSSSALNPLCSLLSKPVISNSQQLHGIFAVSKTPGFSYWSLRQLSHSLISVKSARESILAMAKKHIGVLSAMSQPFHFSSSVMPFFESMPSTVAARKDATFFALDCLCALIFKHHPSTDICADDHAQEAVAILTDIIVLHRPSAQNTKGSAFHIPISVVSWLLVELDKVSSKLIAWASRRLFRACIVSLLKSFSTIKTKQCSQDEKLQLILHYGRLFSLKWTPMAQGTKSSENRAADSIQLHVSPIKYDVPALMRLAVSLHANIESENMKAPLHGDNVLKSPILHILLHEKDKSYVRSDPKSSRNIDDLIKQSYDFLEKEKDYNLTGDTDSPFESILLSLLTEGTARAVVNAESTNLTSVSDDSFLRMVEENIVLSERSQYMRASKTKIIPNWIKQYSAADEIRDVYHPTPIPLDRLFESKEYKSFHNSLCDVLVKTLIHDCPFKRTEVIANECEVSNTAFSREKSESRLLRGLNHLFRSKKDTNQCMSTFLTISMSSDEICSFLSVSLSQLQSLLRTDSSKKRLLVEVDSMVKNILDACNSLQSRSPSEHVPLSNVWAVYKSLADEESSKLLISFLLGAYEEVGQFATKAITSNRTDDETSDMNKISFLDITTSKILDEYIRYIRKTILVSLLSAIGATGRWNAVSSIEEKSSDLDLLIRMLLQLCKDLQMGLNGDSGGMTQSLFTLFVDVINQCVDGISSLAQSMPPSVIHGMKSSFTSIPAAMDSLWGVYLENSLQRAVIIKGTLRLCIDKIPSLLSNFESMLNECISKTRPYSYCLLLFGRCTDGLSSLREEKPIGESTKKEENNCLNFITSDSTEEIGEYHVQKENSCSDKIKNVVNGHLPKCPSAETLPWVYGCVFGSVVNAWNNSYRKIRGRTARERRFSSVDISVSLARQKIEEISNLLCLICQLFNDIGSDQTNDEKGHESNKALNLSDTSTRPSIVLAQFLTFSGKSSFCSCLEKIIATLALSVKQLSKYLTFTSASTNHHATKKETKEDIFRDSNLLESLVCTLGWMNSIITKEVTNNIITGCAKWYIGERWKRSSASFDENRAGGNDDYLVTIRLPKLLFRLEAFEAEFRKLEMIVNATKPNKSSISTERLHLLETVTFTLCESNHENDSDRLGTIMLECLKSINTLKKMIKRNSMNRYLSSEDENENDTGSETEGINNVQNANNRKRRHEGFLLSYKLTRKFRQGALRSRNETIDEWLSMDNEFASAPGERFNTNDAYVDLEDFIVEG